MVVDFLSQTHKARKEVSHDPGALSKGEEGEEA